MITVIAASGSILQGICGHLPNHLWSEGGRFEESFLNFVLQLDLSQGGSLYRTLNRMQWFSGIFDKVEDKVGDKVGQNGCFGTSPSQAFTVDVTVIRDGAAVQGPRLRSPLGYL